MLKRTMVVMLVVVGMMGISSCRLSDAYAARTEAEAYKIRSQAEQKVKDQEVERKRIVIENAYEEARLTAIAAEVDMAWQRGIRYAGLVAIICIVAIGVSISISFKNYSTGMVMAKVKHADLMAGTILPDPITGLFPLFVSRTEHGRLTVYNANTKEVLYLDTHNPVDQEAIRGMGRMLCIYAEKFPTIPMREESVEGKFEMVKNLLEAKV